MKTWNSLHWVIPNLILGCFIHAIAAVDADFFVATDGHDQAPGTVDKPFATLDRARLAVREKMQTHGSIEEIKVIVRGGTYPILEPVLFEAADSGSATLALRYEAYPMERPIFSGAVELRNWAMSDSGLWKTRVGEEVNSFREMYVNETSRPRARHPDEGYFRVGKVGKDRRTYFTVHSADLIPEINDWAGVELGFLHDWSMSRIRIHSFDQDTRELKMRDPVGPSSPHFAMDNFEPNPRYFLENAMEFLDAPGEWYLDEANRSVYYKPLPGESIDGFQALVPQAKALLIVRGDEASGKPVVNLHFKGLHFAYASWSVPEHGYAAGQATYHENRLGEGGALREMLPSAIQFTLAEDWSFTGGSIRHVGTSGLLIGSRCHRAVFSHNIVDDVAGNGILIGEDGSRSVDGRTWRDVFPEQAATGNVISHNRITHCGRQFYGAVAVWAGFTRETRIEHNEIAYHPYTGISMGWMWNPSPTPCRDNRIQYNHIHHVMQILSDGGGIYTLGWQPNSVIRGNVIHDVPLNLGRAESNGMFLDEGTTDFIVEENLIFNVDKSPLRFHRATTNLVRHNLLVTATGTPEIRYNNTKEPDIRKIENRVVESTERTDPNIQALIGQALLRTETGSVWGR